MAGLGPVGFYARASSSLADSTLKYIPIKL